MSREREIALQERRGAHALVGDFVLPHLDGEIEGSREKMNFIARYRRGESLVAAVLCNRKPEEVKKLQEEVRVSMQSRLKK